MLNSAYRFALPTERLRALLFLAGEEEWRDSLGSPVLAAYVDRLADTYDSLGPELQAADRPERAINTVVRQAREAMAEEGYTAAVAFADQALQTVLISAARAGQPLASTSPQDSADAWLANRGTGPTDLVRRFLGELLGQFARHTVARDLQPLVIEQRLASALETRELTETVAEAVKQIANEVDFGQRTAAELASTWSSLIQQAFERGATFPPE